MIQLVNANALKIPLPDESIHMVVTSPPYYALRDYKTNGQLGLEKRADCLGWATGQPCGECYICQMVAVFREVKRVLRGDGVCFLNIGDSYANNNAAGNKTFGNPEFNINRPSRAATITPSKNIPDNLKPKDMLLIPARLALALQAAGWWIRSEIIWHKPNPMPESVTDRPTKSHETIWLMSKSARYFWDSEAVKEPGSDNSHGGNGANAGDKWRLLKGHDGALGMSANQMGTNRNLRDVWTIATQPYSGAHYATYPEALVERCIKAGTSERGVCPKCGKQWERVVERVPATSKDCPKTQAAHKARGGTGVPVGTVGKSGSGRIEGSSTTLGWQPSCECEGKKLYSVFGAGINRREVITGFDGNPSPPIPATVLDPFAGSGTTCLVAKRMGRSAIGMDLSYQYLRENAWERVEMNAPMMI